MAGTVSMHSQLLLPGAFSSKAFAYVPSPCLSGCLAFHPQLQHVRPRSRRVLRGRWTCSAAESRQQENAVLRTETPKVVPSVAPEEPDRKKLFRAEQRRAEVQLPALMLLVRVNEVLEGGGLDAINAGVAGGVTMVVLTEGAGGTDAGALYEAACNLRSLLRGRAELLIAERTDIASASSADGVLLSNQGLPSVIARRMMQGALGREGGEVMPLVARIVSTVEAAAKAAAEGADFLFLQPQEGLSVEDLASGARERCTVPLLTPAGSSNPDLGAVEAGADGVLVDVEALGEDPKGAAIQLLNAIGSARRRQSGSSLESGGGEEGVLRAPGAPMQVLDEQAEVLLEQERELLTKMLALLKEATPEMAELSLLEDALLQLDELFLLVIVGEFNSGKSSVVNALLGERHLREGVVPTTNEITLLKHSDDSHLPGEERSERHPDGHILRYINADLLKQINLVDTPGTNVILQRQQRLTEEFVPRADLVLFVLSADRPLTESEVSFLRYIRQWGKKVIFVLNKADLFTEEAELAEVMAFVRDNAARLLTVEAARVYPVSARRALRAKLAAKQSSNGNGQLDTNHLQHSQDWTTSGFQELERFIAGFLGGGGERLRLKLDTPLGVGAALLGACERQLAEERQQAEADLAALEDVREQLARFRLTMEASSQAQRQQAAELVADARARAGKLVDKLLQLTNVSAISGYLLGSDGTQALPVGSRFEQEVVKDALTELKLLVRQHSSWLASNSARQVAEYRDLARARWPTLSAEVAELGADSDEDTPGSSGRSESLKGVEEFDPRAAALVLDAELREVVLGTAAGTGGAAGTAYVLTTVLPTTLEDLLAVTVCSLVGYLGVVQNLPSQRGKVKEKVARVADNVSQQLRDALKEELESSLSAVEARVEKILSPYKLAASSELTRVERLSSQLAHLSGHLRSLRKNVRSLGE